MSLASASAPAAPAADDDKAAIATSGLTKRFGRQLVVDAVDLSVPRGAVYGFIGPNGSGKTTTIRMLLGLVRPDAGGCQLLGAPHPELRPTCCPGSAPWSRVRRSIFTWRAREPLCAWTRRTPAATLRLPLLGSRTHWIGSGSRVAAGKKYRAYSLGMRQRLGIAGGAAAAA